VPVPILWPNHAKPTNVGLKPNVPPEFVAMLNVNPPPNRHPPAVVRTLLEIMPVMLVVRAIVRLLTPEVPVTVILATYVAVFLQVVALPVMFGNAPTMLLISVP